MRLDLYQEIDREKPLCVSGTSKTVALPAKDIILVDTNILFPLIFPPSERTTHTLFHYSNEIDLKKRPKESIRNKIAEHETKKLIDRWLRVVRYLEAKEFQKMGIYVGITNSVVSELKYLGGLCGKRCVEENLTRINDFTYQLFLHVDDCRRKCKFLSDTFKENGDFSLAYVSLQLGCDFASDDYNSFNVANMNRLKKIYFDRWGGEKRLKRHDSDSLYMLLRSALPKI